jgi:hypothetical protein
MTQFPLENFHFDPPAGFVHEEVVASWRVPPAPGASDPRLMHAQAAVRPNLTVTRVQIEDTNLESIVARTSDELMARIQGIQGIEAAQIEFADGVRGVMIEYAFPVMQLVVVQMQAMRIDGRTLTTLVLCTEASRFTADVRRQWLESLTSAVVKG